MRKVNKPRAQIGPTDNDERERLISADPLAVKYRVEMTPDEQWDAFASSRVFRRVTEMQAAAPKKGRWWNWLLGKEAA